MQRLRAVVAGTHHDAVLVEEGGEVARVHRGVREGHERRARMPLRRVGPVEAQAAHLAHPAVEVGAQLLLVGLHLVHAQAGEVVHRRAQPDGLRDGGGARLEAVGRRRVGG